MAEQAEHLLSLTSSPGRARLAKRGQSGQTRTRWKKFTRDLANFAWVVGWVQPRGLCMASCIWLYLQPHALDLGWIWVPENYLISQCHSLIEKRKAICLPFIFLFQDGKPPGLAQVSAENISCNYTSTTENQPPTQGTPTREFHTDPWGSSRPAGEKKSAG